MFFFKKRYDYSAVYYCIYQHDQSIDGSTPIAMTKAEIEQISIHVSEAEKNFIGFIDRKGVSLQFYVEALDKVWIDIPVVDKAGSYGRYINNDEMFTIIQNLHEPFIQYRKKENLQFRAW